MVEDAHYLCNAGVFSIVIEAVAESAAKAVVKKVKNYKKRFVPTIGIGASRHCNGQILVTDDVVGLTSKYKDNKLPKFVKVFKSYDLELSVKKFCDEVRNRLFPSNEFCYIKNKKISNNITYLKFSEKK